MTKNPRYALSTNPARNAARSALVAAAAALLFCYASTLRGMFDQWMNDEDMGHGAAVPLVVAWIVWRERKRWSAVPREPNAWGFGLMLLGAAMHAAGAVGAGLFASSAGFVISLAGCVVCVGGFALLRAWAFPMLLTLFMLPKLAIVYNQGTLPLQLLASKLAAGILTVSGIGVIREGNILDVHGHRVAVAEACNGIRFLLPLGFTALVFGYLADPKPWMRAVVLLSAIPMAIVANAVRVAAAAWIPALDSGTPHQLIGAAIFILCLASLLPMHWLLNSVYTRYAG